jgi:hypothetical protein
MEARMVSTRIVATAALVAGLFLCVAAIVSAQNAAPWVGMWKLNVAKTTASPGPKPQSMTSVIEPADSGVKVTIDQVNGQGQASHVVSTGKFDGKDSPLEGSQPPVTRAYKRNSDGIEYVTKNQGKLMMTTVWGVSKDGKVLTVTQDGMDPSGQKAHNVLVFEKQ